MSDPELVYEQARVTEADSGGKQREEQGLESLDTKTEFAVSSFV